MNKLSIIICLATLAVICVHAFSQWKPIEDLVIPIKAWYPRLFYNRSADYIGLVGGNISYDSRRIDVHIYDIKEKKWEHIDSIWTDILDNGQDEAEVIQIYAGNLQSFHRLYLILVCNWTFINGDGPEFIEIWELKKDGWECVDIAYHEPFPRRSFSFAISTDGRIMLHGGYYWDDYGRNIYFKQTWIFHFDKWKLVRGSSPGRLWDAALTYDEKNKNFVLFGGGTFKTNRKGNKKIISNRETWIFDETWRKPLVNKKPMRRRSAHMFYNENMEKVVLYGGFRKMSWIRFSDIWTWDGRRWELYDDDTKVDGKVIKGPITYDSRRNRMIALHNGKFWEYKFDKKVK